MVTRTAFLLGLVGIVMLLAGACGGSDKPTASATRAPEIIAAATSTPAGPHAIVEPNAGPPGTEVTVRGSGWEPGSLIDVTGALAPGATADPYKTVVSAADGSFSASFRLEAMPDGTALSTGRYDLIARSPTAEVSVPFLVETKRPVTGTGPNG